MCDASTNFGPPTSFVAWAEPENEEVEMSCKELETDLEKTSDPVEHSCNESSEKGSLSLENTIEENHNTHGDDIHLGKCNIP